MSTTVDRAPELALLTLTDSFMRHLRAANKSPRTLVSYSEACIQLAGFLRARGMPSEPYRITREYLEAFIAELLDRHRPRIVIPALHVMVVVVQKRTEAVFEGP